MSKFKLRCYYIVALKKWAAEAKEIFSVKSNDKTDVGDRVAVSSWNASIWISMSGAASC